MQLYARLHAPQWRPITTYGFREEARAHWERVWQAMAEKGADPLVALVEYAESIGKESPAAWVMELHLFLFGVYPGETWLLRYSEDGFPKKEAQSKRTLLKYLRDLAEEHDKSPYPREWYTKHGCTHAQFVNYLRLEGADDEAAEGSIVAELNAHVPWLGDHLREVYDLMRHPSMKDDLDWVVSGLERLAQRAGDLLGAA